MPRPTKRIAEWQGYFERHCKPKTPNLSYWGRFNEEGLWLARKLQAALIDRAMVRYLRPEEDRQFRLSPEMAL